MVWKFHPSDPGGTETTGTQKWDLTIMVNIFSVSDIEKKAFRATFQDGIWDIYLGAVLFLLGGGAILEELGISGMRDSIVGLIIVAVVLIAGFLMAKRFITVPRLGRVKFGAERKKKIRKTRLVLAASVLLGLILFVFALLTQGSGSPFAALLPLVIFSINCLVVFSLGAYYLDWDRAYLYAWFFALSMPLAVLLREHTAHAFTIVFGFFGGVMILIGTVLLVRFLRAYPRPAIHNRENGV